MKIELTTVELIDLIYQLRTMTELEKEYEKMWVRPTLKINGEDTSSPEMKDMKKRFHEALEKSKEIPEPETKRVVKKQVDRGKIGALHKAGWSVAKIADEMQCAEQTVRNALKELEVEK